MPHVTDTNCLSTSTLGTISSPYTSKPPLLIYSSTSLLTLTPYLTPSIASQVLPGLQSLPLLRLPILLSPDPVRHWSYDGALVDFRLSRLTGAPGDIEAHAGAASAAAGQGSTARYVGGRFRWLVTWARSGRDRGVSCDHPS